MILVTGASGFIGSHLVRALSVEGAAVRALYRNTPPSPEMTSLPGIEWMRCDLLDVYDVEDAMQGIEHVYHCAATVSFNPKDKETLLHGNVESTVNVVNEALEQGVQKLVYVSSVASLGRSSDKKVITEEEQWEESRYNSVYAMSKHLAELEVWRAAGEGLDAVVVNPGIVLGEGNWDGGSARLMKVVDKEFPFYTEGINGWVDVVDVVRAMMALMNSDVKDERFILTAGNFAYREVFTQMAHALGRKPPHIAAGAFLSGLVWRWNAVKSLLGKKVTVTRETAQTAQKKVYYDNSKLLQFFPGFQYTPLATTVERMAVAYKKEVKR